VSAHVLFEKVGVLQPGELDGEAFFERLRQRSAKLNYMPAVSHSAKGRDGRHDCGHTQLTLASQSRNYR